MKTYFQYLIWKPILAVWLIIVLFSLLLPFSICSAIITGITLIVVAYYALNRYCQCVFKKNTPPSYFKNLGFRNMDGILVGSSQAKQIAKNYPNLYDATGYLRNNKMCFNMLKTYFSHVHVNGKVFYVVDLEEDNIVGEYISPCDYLHIHNHIFLLAGISIDKKRQVNPLIYDTAFSLQYVRLYLCDKINHKINLKKKSKHKVTNISAKLVDLLDNVICFCEERHLDCRIILIVPSSMNADTISVGLLTDKVRKSLTIVSNTTEMSEFISPPQESKSNN